MDATGDGFTCAFPGSFGAGHGTAFTYGRHYPNGAAAVSYLYGPDGTWGSLSGLQYVDNFYPTCATSDHPSDMSALISAANGPAFTTRDANCHLLWGDYPGDGGTNVADPQLALPSGNAGSAFHEHSGFGANGVRPAGAPPFTLYWYDDNTLATLMSQAYGQPTPSGLVNVPGFTRWPILAGNAAAWQASPYGSSGNPTPDSYVDTHALNGMYDLAIGNVAAAAQEWTALLALTGATYDSSTQRYLYPSAAMGTNYYFGLFKILTDELRANAGSLGAGDPSDSVLLQHSIALDSNILDNQQIDSGSGALIGWTTNVPTAGSLINTETVAAQVLGLGARANSVFEPGVLPLTNDANEYFLRPFHALSAVVGLSQPGYMTRGPGFLAPPGTYAVDFRLRAPTASGTVATVSVTDGSANVLATQDVGAAQVAASNAWTEVTLSVTVTGPCTLLDLRTYWTGTSNLDLGPVRVG